MAEEVAGEAAGEEEEEEEAEDNVNEAGAAGTVGRSGTEADVRADPGDMVRMVSGMGESGEAELTALCRRLAVAEVTLGAGREEGMEE